jgi:dolichol kinase
MDELHLLLQHLQQPEYVHVLLNPLPVYATAMGVLALTIGLLMRSKQAQTVALIVVIVGCASAYPVLRYGQRGYDRVYAMSNSEAQQWLDLHMQRAERFVYVFYATGIVALATLVAMSKFPQAAISLAMVTLIMAALSIGAGGWIGHAGGQVRHSEFREGPPPNSAGHEEEHEHNHAH